MYLAIRAGYSTLQALGDSTGKERTLRRRRRSRELGRTPLATKQVER